jgi:protein-disulfide isomerase
MFFKLSKKPEFVGKIKKAKEDKNAYKSKSGKTKFILVGIVASIVAAGVSAAMLGGNDQNTRYSVDTSKGSPVLGSESAPVTIIEFGDYQCPFCQRWNQNTKPLIEQSYINEGKAKLVFVDLPIIGQDSITAHAGSYCADEQGLYWQYHDFVYKNQGHENDGWTNAVNLKTMVSQIDGLDSQAFDQCLDSKKYEDRVRENGKIASKAGARSTPSFIIIGQDGKATQVTGAQPYETFQMIIDEKLAS